MNDDLAQRQAAFAATPANQLLGMRLLESDATAARVAMTVRRELIQEKGVVHGGFLATLADTTAVYVLLPELPADRGLAGVEFKINFLRPARLNGGDLEARARLIKRGRTLSVVVVEVEQATTKIATGLFTYMATRGPEETCGNG